MKKKIILINGPVQVGKSTTADGLFKVLSNAARVNMADHLKTMTHAFYGLPLDPNHYEKVKHIPLPEFGGRTPREAYIFMSEKVAKQQHGALFFGHIYQAKVDEVKQDTILTADTGFAGELIPIIHAHGVDNIRLIRLRGLGATYNGDSRSYVHWPDVIEAYGKYLDEKVPYPYGPSLRDVDLSRPFQDFDIENVEGKPEIALQQVIEIYNELNDDYIRRADHTPSFA